MRQSAELGKNNSAGRSTLHDDFVLEKGIFNKVFEKDIRRVFVYKKTERLAKAIHLIAPAFAEEVSLRDRLNRIAIGLIDAAIEPTASRRTALSRELLTLSSVLSLARTSNLLSPMNADLITQEARLLLQEVAEYEEPRLSLDEAPTLSALAKDALSREAAHAAPVARLRASPASAPLRGKGQVKDTDLVPVTHIKDRSEAVMSVIRTRGSVSIKDISTMVRGVSEKTIQRELAALIQAGVVRKQGERRWSTYSLI